MLKKPQPLLSTLTFQLPQVVAVFADVHVMCCTLHRQIIHLAFDTPQDETSPQ